MPLKCRACGQCHTARRGCADVYATLERMAGSMPEPKDTPGEWVLECGKHHQPYRACCEGRYTLKWRWKDADPTPPPIATGDAYSRDRVIAEIEGVVRARLQEARTANQPSDRNYLAAQLGAVRGMLERLTDRDFVARLALESRRDELEQELAALETPPHD
jgi:hypothetical protein